MTDLLYANQFRSVDTEQGSFRSNSHNWSDDHAIVSAVELLIDNQEAELHICDHNLYGNQTHHVLIMHKEASWVNGEKYQITHTFNAKSCYKFCTGDSAVSIAATIGLFLGTLKGELNDVQVFLQPNAHNRKILDAEYKQPVVSA